MHGVPGTPKPLGECSVKCPIRQITKTIEAPWTEAVRRELISFWSARRFRFFGTSDASLSAKRGHILWNLVAYDMTRLRADLSIHPAAPDRISLVLTVHTVYQVITPCNQAFWELEMTTCESVLLRGDRRDAEWVQFMKASRKAAIVWTLTLGLGGRSEPFKWGK
jgi:hypothetical protein